MLGAMWQITWYIIGGQTRTSTDLYVGVCGAWWLSGKFGALRPEGRRFKSHCGRQVGTSSHSFTHSCL